MKERIKEYIEFKKINAGELAQLLDVQRSNISHILNGRNKPGAVFLEKLLNAFPDLNGRWLITGHGSMTTDSEENQATVKQISEELPFGNNVDEQSKVKTIVEKSNTLIADSSHIRKTPRVDRIVFFFSDGSFETYMPK